MLPEEFVPISPSPFSKLKRAIDWSAYAVNKANKNVYITTICHLYETDEKEPDGYGKEILSLEVKPFEKTLVATNSTLVNPQNGLHAILVIDTPEERNESGEIIQAQTSHYVDSLGNIVQTPMGQFDYFYNVIMRFSIKVHDIILSVLQAEDQIYHTYDS